MPHTIMITGHIIYIDLYFEHKSFIKIKWELNFTFIYQIVLQLKSNAVYILSTLGSAHMYSLE